MAPVGYAREWRAGIDRRIASDPQYAKDLLAVIERLNDDAAAPAWLDHVVSQPWRQLRRDWYDAAALIEVGLMLQAGWCVITAAEVGAKPGRDKDGPGNNAKLKRLQPAFDAEFVGATQDDDGRLEWQDDLEVIHDMGEGHLITVRYPPSGVPLEVGRTEPETTIWHLVRDGGVARWPYGESHVTLLLATCPMARDALALAMPEVIEGSRRLRPPPLADLPDVG